MRKWLPWLIIVVLLFWISTFYYSHENPIDSKVDTIKIKEIEYINDSIKIVIDSSKTKIKYIDNWYEKELIDITNQSISADIEFFTNYLETQDCK